MSWKHTMRAIQAEYRRQAREETNPDKATIMALVIALLAVAFAAFLLIQSPVAQQTTLTPRAFLPYVSCEVTPTPRPAYALEGSVRLVNGDGVAGVEIREGYTYQPCESMLGWLVATTDPEGYYEGLHGCPLGYDETITIKPVRPGYVFEPDCVWFRTYGYCWDLTLNFVAMPDSN